MTTINAVDLFSGIGGLTYGLELAGINVVAGIDIEGKCKYPYEINTNSVFIEKDIKKVTANEIENLYPEDTEVKVLVGCAPCQPFSRYSYRYKKNDENQFGNNMDLLDYFGDLIVKIQPDIVSMENVPQLENNPIFLKFVNLLVSNGYEVNYDILYGPDYGVPQIRKRLVLLASKHGRIDFVEPIYNEDNYLTVRDAIGDIEPIEAGEISDSDLLHQSAKLSEKNLKRIRQSSPGGTWKDWDEDLILNAHKKSTGSSYRSVYGRMEWDKPSPTITTQFYGYGNGRFGHPEQDRALSLREGAILQTFPSEFKFYDDRSETKINKRDIGIIIGNAVPVRLAQAIGQSIVNFINLNEDNNID